MTGQTLRCLLQKIVSNGRCGLSSQSVNAKREQLASCASLCPRVSGGSKVRDLRVGLGRGVPWCLPRRPPAGVFNVYCFKKCIIETVDCTYKIRCLQCQKYNFFKPKTSNLIRATHFDLRVLRLGGVRGLRVRGRVGRGVPRCLPRRPHASAGSQPEDEKNKLNRTPDGKHDSSDAQKPLVKTAKKIRNET